MEERWHVYWKIRLRVRQFCARPFHSCPTRRSSDLAPATLPHVRPDCLRAVERAGEIHPQVAVPELGLDRKSTRLNSSHTVTSYAVFCLKKKSDCFRVAASYSRTKVRCRILPPAPQY